MSNNDIILSQIRQRLEILYQMVDELEASGGGGGGGGTTNYNELSNKPSIEGQQLVGNKTASDLGLATTSQLNRKVDKEEGSSLMTTAQANKLEGIESGAEVNVQANWNETDTTSDAYILNKPTLPDMTNYYTKSQVDASQATQNTEIGSLADRGAKNLLNLVEPTTLNRTTITDSGDGSVTASCINVTWANSGYEFSLTAGKAYKFIIYVESASVSDVQFKCFVNDISGSEVQELGRTSRITSAGVYSIDFVATTKICVKINLNNSGTAATGSATYHAMLCTAENYAISPEFVPYAPTNRELFEMKADKSIVGLKLVASNTMASSSTYTYAMNKNDFIDSSPDLGRSIGTYIISIMPWSTNPTYSLYAVSYTGGSFGYTAITKIAGTDMSITVANGVISVSGLPNAGGKISIHALQ